MIVLVPMLVLQAATAQQQAPAAAPSAPPAARATVPAQIGVAVRPDTVTVGERFTVIVRVRAPAGSSIEFPPGPDSGGNVDLAAEPVIAEPRTIAQSDGAAAVVEQIAGYRLAAWDVGQQQLGMGNVVVRSALAERVIPLAPYTVFVRSVLPADTTLHVPKPPRGELAFAWPWWVKWLLLALAVVLAMLLAWWLWRVYRRWKNRPVHPAALAQREFHRVEKLGLPDKDEGALHVALMVDVLRSYLSARVAGVRESHTSAELVAAARTSGALDPAATKPLADLLHESDLAKFAARYVEPARARELGAVARSFVADVEARFEEQERRKAA